MITDISLQRHRGSQRLNVFLDDAYAFSLAATLGSAIHRGTRLDSNDVRTLLEQDAAERAYERALSFLAARPRSIAEVRRRLTEAQLSPTAIDSAVERLARNGYVDDRAFAAYWVEQRLKFHPRGPRALRAELRAKGVDSETAGSVATPPCGDQVEAACHAAERRSDRLLRGPDGTIDEREFRQAISAFLVRRGFDYSVVRDAVRRLWEEHRTLRCLDQP